MIVIVSAVSGAVYSDVLLPVSIIPLLADQLKKLILSVTDSSVMGVPAHRYKVSSVGVVIKSTAFVVGVIFKLKESEPVIPTKRASNSVSGPKSVSRVHGKVDVPPIRVSTDIPLIKNSTSSSVSNASISIS